MRLRDLARDRVVGAYAILTAALFWQPLTFGTFYFRDLYLLFYPQKRLFADALRSGQFPLWDPFLSGGRPYLATPSNFALHPSNVLYLFLPTIVAFNLVLVLHVFLCAVAGYWLARVVRLPAPAAAITGAVFAFCGFTLSTANLTPLLLGLPWIPFTIGLTHRALRDGRSIAPAAVAAAMPLFGAAAELTAMLFVTLVVWIVFARTPAPWRTRAIAGAVVIVFSAGLSLVVLAPARSVIAQSERSEKRSYDAFAQWSVDPVRLGELVVPRFFGRTNTLSESGYWGRTHESQGFPYILSLYLGIPALFLAIAGARNRETEMPVRALAVLATAGIFLSLGSTLPFFRLLYEHVPLVAIFRFPVKAQIIALLPIALLAGAGAREPLKSLRFAAATLAVPLAALAAGVWSSAAFLAAFTRAFGFAPLGPAERVVLVLSLLHAAVAALAFTFVTSARSCAVIVMADLLVAGASVNHYAPRSLFDEPPIAGVVRQAIGDGRFYSAPHEISLRAPTDDLKWLARLQLATLNSYAAHAFGIPVIYHGDYDLLGSRRIDELSRQVQTASWPARREFLDRAGVRAFIAAEEVQLPGIRELSRQKTPDGLLVLYANENASRQRFSGACGTAPVRVVQRSLNGATYEVDAPCSGLLFLAEPFYDGWRSRVDGAEVAEQRAGVAFTAIPLQRGHHRVERRYFPPGFIAGLIGSLASALLLLLMTKSLARMPREAFQSPGEVRS